jgi:predicted acetyltransferase
MHHLSIERATPGDKNLLFRLMQLYYFEATRWSGEDILEDGHYECDEDGVSSYLDADGTDQAYILRVDGMPAGFALVEEVPHADTRIHEFADLFVLPKYRRIGLGAAATKRIVIDSDRPWLFAIFRKDQDAQSYWRAAFERLPFRSVRQLADEDLFHLFVINE